MSWTLRSHQCTAVSGLLGFEVLVVVLIVYITVLSIYRLYFHPLAQLPGPVFARTTDWYNVFTAIGNDRHLDFYRLHEKYGPVVRYGPSRVSFNSNTALSQIYNSRANVQKSSYYSIFSYYFKVPSVLTSITHKDHGPKRRFVSQALSDSAIQAMEEHVLRNVRTFCNKMLVNNDFTGNVSVAEKGTATPTGWGPHKNISQWSGYLTFDIMGALCFSRTFDMLHSSANHYIIDVMPRGVQCFNALGHMQWLARLHLDKVFFRRLSAANKRYEAFSRDMAIKRSRKSDNIQTKDAFYFLQKGEDPESGKKLTQEELIAEASLLILGGTDTTATAITSTIFYLLHNPVCLQKLQFEVRSTFASSEEIRGGSALTSCRYLRACIDEGLRMTPGVGGILPRQVLPGGITIDKITLPAGVDVGVPIYAIQHNEAYYPRPFDYIPERWLVDESSSDKGVIGHSESVALARSAFCAFSLGPWSCAGKGMAYKEISLVIARLLWLYEMKISEGTQVGQGDPNKRPETMRHRINELQGNDRFVLQTDGPIVQFRLRDKAVSPIAGVAQRRSLR